MFSKHVLEISHESEHYPGCFSVNLDRVLNKWENLLGGVRLSGELR